MNDQAHLSAHWQTLAKRCARKVNLGWWLESLTPILVTTSVVTFVGILWLRSSGDEWSLNRVWPGLAVGGLGCLFLSLLIARKKFINVGQALIRLESQLKLHNALTVALAGRGAWPEVPQTAEDGWQWRWSWIGAPWLTSLACITLALWIPISTEIAGTLPTMEPQSWQKMEEWLEKLEEEKIITPEEKQEEAAKIAELRDQPPEKWFSHDSLHAGDSLKEQLQRNMAQMSQDMKTLERSLNALQNYADKLSQATKDQLLKDMDEALKGLQSNAMELNPDLLKELSQIDPNNLSSLSKEQLDQLRQSLKNGGKELQGLAQNPGFLGDGEGADDELAEMLGKMGQGQGQGEGQDGDGPGNGGVSRGPGTAPLTLSDEENNFGTQKNEGVSNLDMSRAQLGTNLGIQDGKHDVDKTYNGPAAAGNTAGKGQGGEQVWRETLTPEEKAVLKRVFQ